MSVQKLDRYLLQISASISDLFLMILEPGKGLQTKLIFFPGHLNIGQFKLFKKIEILLNLSQGGRGY